MKDFLELAKARYSVRGFDGCDIPDADIDKIIEAGILAHRCELPADKDMGIQKRGSAP